jgi:SOS-response transcriptional repressor LexA
MEQSAGIAERFAHIRARQGLSKKAFAESLGIHPVVAGDIELGKREPSREVLVRLAEVYGADITWLLTGGSARGRGLNEGSVVPISFIKQEAAAGRGVEIDDFAESETIAVPRSFIAPHRPERVRALPVRGDSMTGAGIDDGDIVLFSEEDRVGDGIHVVSIASRLLVKRIHLDPAGRRVEVISENPSYPIRVLEGPDLEDFRVAGRVIASLPRH